MKCGFATQLYWKKMEKGTTTNLFLLAIALSNCPRCSYLAFLVARFSRNSNSSGGSIIEGLLSYYWSPYYQMTKVLCRSICLATNSEFFWTFCLSYLKFEVFLVFSLWVVLWTEHKKKEGGKKLPHKSPFIGAWGGASTRWEKAWCRVSVLLGPYTLWRRQVERQVGKARLTCWNILIWNRTLSTSVVGLSVSLWKITSIVCKM